ncbi:MAG TPA: DUF5715 family protein, partial [Blastocatellia bacterium]|nr:DUF5715 family protein [Blastocatellia bacterium]
TALTHFDKQTHASIPLFSDESQFAALDRGMAAQIESLQNDIAGLTKQLAQTGRRDRARRGWLRSQVLADQNTLESRAGEKTLAESYHADPDKRAMLEAQYETVARLAANFAGRSYDLKDPVQSAEFKRRLLCFVRPAARSILEQIAAAYGKEFNKPLPVTSLVRTEEYQYELSRRNPNAARDAVPPHTTGLAFDIYYHYMNAAEQTFLMDYIASLKQAGQVEALRETRDHIHVFAFAQGHPPPENLVETSIVELQGDRTGRRELVKWKRARGRGRSRYGR